MVNALEVPADALIKRVADKLKSEYGQIVRPPHWAHFAKTGVYKEKPPRDEGWWYVRAASIMRKLYKAGEPVGIETFRVIYGGRERRGSSPPHFRKGSGSIARRILQQLEDAGLVSKVPGAGRVLSPRGRSLLDTTAREIIEDLAKAKPELSKYI
ncbi:MAG: 30S ribosomal protein S19e [Acidilobaceae archaeon]